MMGFFLLDMVQRAGKLSFTQLSGLFAHIHSLPQIAEPAPSAADGPPWWFLAAIVAGITAVGFLVLLLALRGGKGRTEMPCLNCQRVLMSDWDKCMFCGTPRGQKMAAPELQVVSGPLSGQNVKLGAEVCTIGSAQGSTVTLTDPGVSRKHAGIRAVEDGYELADLGSTNGVYVNGERVARRKLISGDVIRVGTTEMVYRL